MNDPSNKKLRTGTSAGSAEAIHISPPHDGLPLPDTIIFDEIFSRLELESLCSLACVSRCLRSTVSHALCSLPSVDLSAFSPGGSILSHIFHRLGEVKMVTIDCLRLDDFSIISILGPHILELNLLKCASLSYDVLASVGERFPNLRILVLELAGDRSPENFKRNLVEMLKRTRCLESLSIKVRGTELDACDLACIDLFLPKTLKFLKLQPVNEEDACQFINELKDEREEIPINVMNYTIPAYSLPVFFMLNRLSLVLNVISDRLIKTITSSLAHLVELDIEDRPCAEPKTSRDLTNNGLQHFASCLYLTSLSIVRSRLNYPVSFKRVNDLGIMLLSESCRGLESVTLGGFSTVTDAGFSSFIRSCYNLKKLEIRNAPLLSDLAFQDVIGIICPLVELKLASCNLITSEAVLGLASSSTLELLDTYGCRSIADPLLDYISCLNTLTTLNLGGADITDYGLAALSRGDLPISKLCLRGCTRVTDRGIICLINSGKRISKTLLSLDISNMPGVCDRAIQAVVSSAPPITELCIRYCFHVTDASLKMLAFWCSEGKSNLKKLDLCHCKLFSAEQVELFEGSLFRSLRWVGLGGTSLVNKRDVFDVISGKRPWLTVCFEGCEVGCHDGWQFHRYDGSSF